MTDTPELELPPESPVPGTPEAEDPSQGIEQETQARIDKWRKRAGRVNAAQVAAVLDDPAQRAVVTHAFAYAHELADCCIAHPPVVFEALAGRGAALIDQCERDLLALDRAWGPTEVLSIALRPLRDQVFATVALNALSGRTTAAEAHKAMTHAAERMLDAALNALVRRAAKHGELAINTDPMPQPLPGLFVLGGGDFGAGETGYAGPLELAVIYDPVRLSEAGISVTASERALIHIAAELKEAFASPAKGAPLFAVGLESIGIGKHVRMALNADDVLYNIGLAPPQPRRAWFAASRVVAGDRRGGEAFLSRVHERLYAGRYGAVDLALAAEDFTKPVQRNASLTPPQPEALTRMLLCLRLILGAKSPEVLLAPARRVFEVAQERGVLAPDLTEALTLALDIQRAARDAMHLVAGAVPASAGQSVRYRAAQAALSGYKDVAAFVQAVEAADAEADAAWDALVRAAPLAAKKPADAAPSLVVRAESNPLEALGFRNGGTVATMIDRWVPKADGVHGAKRMAELVPGLITALAETDDPNGAIERFDRFLSAAAHDGAIFTAMNNDPKLIQEVANVFGNAPAVAESFIRSKRLPREWPTWDLAPDVPVAAADWIEHNVDLGPHALSGEALRAWGRDMRAQAACDVIGGRLEAAEINAVFTAIAEAMVKRAYDICTAKHTGRRPDIGVIAMGALGSRMLAFDDPLELVFVFDGDPETPAPERTVAAATFASELMNELTGGVDEAAPLYRIDLNRRPGGQGGEIAASLKAYLSYYGGPASPAEHLALTRARILAAPEELRLRLETGLRDILTRGRRPDRLAAEADRVRHRNARDSDSGNRWDLDAMQGGIGDISLVAAALQLRFSAEHPYVLSPDPISAFQSLTRAGCLDADTGAELTETYRFYARINAILAIAGRADLGARRPRPLLADLIARAAGVMEFVSVEPLIQGHADRTFAHYKRLFLMPQPIPMPERRNATFRIRG